MAKYAVIRVGGKQYKVEEGQEVLVDKVIDIKSLAPEVLLVADGENVEVGRPVLTKTGLKFKVITELEKGVKVDVYKFKAKSRYRKHVGFRSQHTRLLIEKI